MEKIKKYLPIICRILLGLIFVGSAIATFTMDEIPPPESVKAQNFSTALFESRLLIVVKVLELMSGILLLSGFFVPLALIIIAPIIFNIAFFHFVLEPNGIVMACVLILLWIGAAIGVKQTFMPMLKSKSQS